MTRNEVDLDEIVSESSKLPTFEFDDKFTKTTRFMLPALDMSSEGRYMRKYLRNAFLDDIGMDHDFERPIFLLFAVKNMKELDWKELRKAIRSKKEYNDIYLHDYYVGFEVETKMHLIMYVFRIPDNWASDYYLFKRGKYSKFSTEYKKKFPREITSIGGKTTESVAWGAIYKSESLKNFVKKRLFAPEDEHLVDTLDEIWGTPVREREYFRYGQYVSDRETFPKTI